MIAVILFLTRFITGPPQAQGALTQQDTPTAAHYSELIGSSPKDNARQQDLAHDTGSCKPFRKTCAFKTIKNQSRCAVSQCYTGRRTL